MDLIQGKKPDFVIIAIIVSLIALTVFLFDTKIVNNPLVLILLSVFVLFPFRKESQFVRRLILLISLIFIGWLLADLGFAILPFAISFLIAYLLNPFINKLKEKNIPRWISALVIDLLFIGIISAIAIYIFPIIFAQLDDALKKISTLVTSVSKDLDERSIYKFFSKFGFDKKVFRGIIQTEFVPRLEGILSGILHAFLEFLTNLSLVATKLVNVVLIPVLLFYFLKDFQKIRDLVRKILEQRNLKMLNDLKRIDIMLRKYIGWQITAAFIVGTVCSVFFTIFNVPYSIVLGMLCGIMNPIPYIGLFASMVISIITIIIVDPPEMFQLILIVLIVINAMHFINAYLLEPNIAGKQIGLHPVILIASLFVFGGLFGFFGLLIAVPLTATLMMFYKDWVVKYTSPKSSPLEEKQVIASKK
ncbi:MAG: AI-2E family transporter [Ignavibacteriae bacterium]|nr:AI-2E family transporter [Ignavibacteriota bacterium]